MVEGKRVKVVAIYQSRVAPKLWSLEFDCGHSVDVTSDTQPDHRKEATCIECDKQDHGEEEENGE